MTHCTASAFQPLGQLSTAANGTEGLTLVLFSSSKECAWIQQYGDLQDLDLCRYQNIFKATCLKPDFLIISNRPHTKADVCAITFAGSDLNLSSSRGAPVTSGKL